MKDKTLIQRRWFDFRMGYSGYLFFIIGLSNFTILIHTFVLEQIPLIAAIPLWLFAIVVLAVGLPLGIFIGFLHRRYQMPVEAGQIQRFNEFRDKILPKSKETLVNESTLFNYDLAKFNLHCLNIILINMSELSNRDKKQIQKEVQDLDYRLAGWKRKFIRYGHGEFASKVISDETV